MLKTGIINGNSFSIKANGNDVTGLAALDAAGGGGAGGSIFIQANSAGNTNLNIELNGGFGGDNGLISSNNNNAGTGGGGSGGYFVFSGALIPPNYTVSLAGGAAGLITYSGSSLFGTNYGSMPGGLGLSRNSLTLNESNVPVTLNQAVLGPDTLLCNGNSISLSVVASNSVLWSTGDTGSSIIASAPDTVWVSVEQYCPASDTIVLFHNTSSFSLGPDTTLCTNDSLFLSAPAGGTSYAWNTGSINQAILVDNAGTYSVMIDNNGCIAEDSITVNFSVSQQFSLGTDTVLCSGDTLHLQSPISTPLMWSTGSQNSSIQVISSGQYFVEYDSNSCFVGDTINVGFENCFTEVDCKIAFPNVFLPNADGVNDVFTPMNQSSCEIERIIILNRWGQIVFEQGPANSFKWNGKNLAGNQVPESTYYYEVQFPDGFQTGYLTLLR